MNSWEPVEYHGWKQAWRLRQGEMELTAIADIGPRLLCLRARSGGENLLWEDPSRQMGRGEWKILGGHRLWISPESEDCYAPDTGPCEVTRREEGALCLTAPPLPRSGLQRSLAIRALAAPGWFEVSHRVLNTGALVYPGALWALTCVNPVGKIVFPWGVGSKSWQLKQITYWSRWETHETRPASPQYRPGADVFTVMPLGEEGKVGAAPREGWLAHLRDNATLLKVYSPEEGGVYPDAGCSLEVYTCRHFMEMETLTPLRTLYPGEARSHIERWFVAPKPLAEAELFDLAASAWERK